MVTKAQIKEALLIRRIEEAFLELFSAGKLNGTVHTCVGQEFSAVAFAGQVQKDDFIFSNHRCHGHFISYTKDHLGLIAELLGKKSGVCGGIGSSQHLQARNFYSNGIQGGIVPLAAGMALANKLQKDEKIGIVFIGDGTLGEGVLYETLNIASLWKLPLLFVCENNLYAQSTSVKNNLAGDIRKRAEAFSIQTFESDTWDVEALFASAKSSIDFVRTKQTPAFHLVNTYRLNAHSKGDDDRDKEEISTYREKDYLVKFAQMQPLEHAQYLEEINAVVSEAITEVLEQRELSLAEFTAASQPNFDSHTWTALVKSGQRQVVLINKFFDAGLGNNRKMLFIGEDVLSPYGGAFKVAKGLSEKYPDQVFTTPLSEAAIVGIGNGLALAGFKPFVEIMFGDFITLALDQIINHASKFYQMYNKKINCPIVIRTPMGGRRGYGPTHSQTLDKFLIGIDNVTVVALNTLIDPGILYQALGDEPNPVIVIENKVDYGAEVGAWTIPNYDLMVNNEKYPVVKISPKKSQPSLTIVTYGGMVNEVLGSITDVFFELDYKPEVLVLSRINPIDYQVILDSVLKTKRLVVIEEGSTTGGIGSEILSTVAEKSGEKIEMLRIGSLATPIPSVKSLEEAVIPNRKSIVELIGKHFK